MLGHGEGYKLREGAVGAHSQNTTTFIDYRSRPQSTVRVFVVRTVRAPFTYQPPLRVGTT
jgi:hypothetical protein